MEDICSQADAFQVSGLNGLDNSLFLGINKILIWIIGLHNIRLYITLEMLDDEDFIFENFFTNANRLQRFLEFVIRIVIVGIVSLKIIKWSASDDLPNYMFWLYLSLLSWGVVVGTFDLKNWKHWFKNTYLLISIFGLLFAMSSKYMIQLQINDSVLVWGIVLFTFLILIIADVIIDLYKNWGQYNLYFTTIKQDLVNFGK